MFIRDICMLAYIFATFFYLTTSIWVQFPSSCRTCFNSSFSEDLGVKTQYSSMKIALLFEDITPFSSF